MSWDYFTEIKSTIWNILGWLYTFRISHFMGILHMFSGNTPQIVRHSLYTFYISGEFRILFMLRKNKLRNPLARYTRFANNSEIGAKQWKNDVRRIVCKRCLPCFENRFFAVRCMQDLRRGSSLVDEHKVLFVEKKLSATLKLTANNKPSTATRSSRFHQQYFIRWKNNFVSYSSCLRIVYSGLLSFRANAEPGAKCCEMQKVKKGARNARKVTRNTPLCIFCFSRFVPIFACFTISVYPALKRI